MRKKNIQNPDDIRGISEVPGAVPASGQAAADTCLQLHENGRKYKTAYTRKFAERKPWKAPDRNELRSILPGNVDSILVKPGDAVKKGEKLMIYEAMKMKNIIAAPFDAVVVSVEVNRGDNLPKDALLMRLKPAQN